MREPDSHRFDTHAAEVYYGFASDVRPEREYDHDDDPDFGNRAERSKSREWMAAMDTGDMELAASLFGEMTDVEQQDAQIAASPRLCARCHTIHAADFPCWQHRGTDASGSGPQPSPAPSQPELPRMSNDVRDRLFRTILKERDTALRENQQLRQQLDQAGEVLTKYEEQLAQIRKPIDLSEDDIEAATQWCSKIARESLRKEYIKIDAANRALVRTIAQLRQQVKDVDKSAKSLYLALYQCGVVIEFVPGSPKIRNQRAETAEQQLTEEVRVRKEVVAQHATQALDNARLKERITELETELRGLKAVGCSEFEFDTEGGK